MTNTPFFLKRKIKKKLKKWKTKNKEKRKSSIKPKDLARQSKTLADKTKNATNLPPSRFN
jgi:hypothetical protein